MTPALSPRKPKLRERSRRSGRRARSPRSRLCGIGPRFVGISRRRRAIAAVGSIAAAGVAIAIIHTTEPSRSSQSAKAAAPSTTPGSRWACCWRPRGREVWRTGDLQPSQRERESPVRSSLFGDVSLEIRDGFQVAVHNAEMSPASQRVRRFVRAASSRLRSSSVRRSAASPAASVSSARRTSSTSSVRAFADWRRIAPASSLVART
jgi:hypothetical protein